MALDPLNNKPLLKPSTRKQRLKKFLKSKYFIIPLILVAAFLIYWFFLKPAKVVTQYTVTTVRQGTLTTTVSGSGQVSALNQVNIKPQTTDKVMTVSVKVGDQVKTGQQLITLDETDNALSLKQAQANYLSAQANYNQVLAGAASTDVKISQLSVDQAQTAYVSAQNDLAQTRTTVATNLAQAQKDLDDLLDTTVTAPNNKRSQVVIADENAINAAQNALDAINKVLNDQGAKNGLGSLDSVALPNTQAAYQAALIYAAPAKASLQTAKNSRLDANLDSSVSATLSLLNATLTAANNCFYLLQNSTISSTFTQSSLDTYKSSASSQVSNMNSNLSTVQSTWQSLTDAITAAQNTLTNAQLSGDQQITAAQNKVTSALQSLNNAKAQFNKTTAPATKQAVQASQASLISAQAQLQAAQTAYDKNIIASPIDGLVAEVNATVGLQADSTSSIVTIVTSQKIAIIQFNQVDTAKLKVGQEAALTFDALPNLTIKGKVLEINGVGVATQGVVSYDVKISFDNSAEANILPGMTVSAVVTTEVKPNVLLVPSQAVKTAGNFSYVQTLSAYTPVNSNNRRGPVTSTSTPQRVPVTVGDANDTLTEIVSGLSEGETVVLTTISTSTTAASASTNTGFRIPGLGGGGGGGGTFRAAGGGTTGGAAGGAARGQ